jgi:hypothetical protein
MAPSDDAGSRAASGSRASPLPELTRAWILEDQLPDDRVLTFSFLTGPDNPQLSCAEVHEPEDDDTRKTAILLGWLVRQCEQDHIQFRLSADGRRLSSSWGRSSDSPVQPRKPENENELTGWFVPVANFRRTGAIDILPADLAECGSCASDGVEAMKKVVVHGHWEPNATGKRLARVGWPPIAADRLEQTFVFRRGTWQRIEHVAP